MILGIEVLEDILISWFVIILGLLGSRPVAVLGWGQGAQAPQILPRPPAQIFGWFRSALFLLEGF